MTTTTDKDLRDHLLDRLTPTQARAVQSESRRLVVVAGAGSGKTEVMARRIAWDVGVNGVPKDQIVAFTFTEKSAEEMQFRVRRHLAVPGLRRRGQHARRHIRQHDPLVLPAAAPAARARHVPQLRRARGRRTDRPRGAALYGTLAGRALETAFRAAGLARGHFDAVHAYDLLNEYHRLGVVLPDGTPPGPGQTERDWCVQAALTTVVGDDDDARAFAVTAARFDALLRCRRILDFSTAQAELLRLLECDEGARTTLRDGLAHLVVDEV